MLREDKIGSTDSLASSGDFVEPESRIETITFFDVKYPRPHWGKPDRRREQHSHRGYAVLYDRHLMPGKATRIDIFSLRTVPMRVSTSMDRVLRLFLRVVRVCAINAIVCEGISPEPG